LTSATAVFEGALKPEPLRFSTFMLRNLVLTFMAAAALAALSRTLTIDDILSLRRCSRADFSDGSHVAYLSKSQTMNCIRRIRFSRRYGSLGRPKPASRLIAKG